MNSIHIVLIGQNLQENHISEKDLFIITSIILILNIRIINYILIYHMMTKMMCSSQLINLI